MNNLWTTREETCCHEKCDDNGNCWHDCDRMCELEIEHEQANIEEERCALWEDQDCHHVQEWRNRIESDTKHHNTMQELDAREQECCYEQCNEHGDCWEECDHGCHLDIRKERLGAEGARCQEQGWDCSWHEDEQNHLANDITHHQNNMAHEETMKDLNAREEECCREECNETGTAGTSATRSAT